MISKTDVKFVNIPCWECTKIINVLEFSKHFEDEHVEND